MDGNLINADVVVLAMGPWTSQAKPYFPKCKYFPCIRGGKAHSIVVQADVSPDALFFSYETEDAKDEDPEFYPRYNFFYKRN